jgi:pantoate kinase
LRVKVFHSFDLPVGCGYGASGSGALGLIYGLNQLLKLEFSHYELGRIAHIAEVINKTGLGTVCGQLAGGLCILKEPGYPCNYEKIKIPNHLKIVCGSFGKLYTKSILTDPNLNLRIKNAGRKALCKLIHDPNIITFIKASNDFVNDTDILNILNLNKVQELIQSLNQLDILGASMNQLGRSVYAICKKQNESKVLEVFECYTPEIKIYSSCIRENNKIIIQ